MMKLLTLPLFFWTILVLPLQAQTEMTAEQSKRLNEVIKQAGDIAKSPELVAAVRDYNSKGHVAMKDMDQEQWSKLTIMDPFVKELRSNPTAKLLQTKKADVVSEAFVSGADGTKVAFLSKPSNWSHKGKDKHDEPMAGKTWLGKPEKDASTGLSQVQFALPILDAGKPIGSLVIGVALNKL